MDYGVEGDLTAMGKMVGGGFPIGAVPVNDVMDVMTPFGAVSASALRNLLGQPDEHGRRVHRDEALR